MDFAGPVRGGRGAFRGGQAMGEAKSRRTRMSLNCEVNFGEVGFP
jgi:hypothetical protein